MLFLRSEVPSSLTHTIKPFFLMFKNNELSSGDGYVDCNHFADKLCTDLQHLV